MNDPSFSLLFGVLLDLIFYSTQKCRRSFYVFTEGVFCFALQRHRDGYTLMFFGIVESLL